MNYTPIKDLDKKSINVFYLECCSHKSIFKKNAFAFKLYNTSIHTKRHMIIIANYDHCRTFKTEVRLSNDSNEGEGCSP